MRYESPTTLDAAVGLLAGASGSAYLLAGGTDLLVRLRSGFVDPDLVIDLKRIDALNQMVMTADGLRIGAAVPSAAMSENPVATGGWPGVCEAAALIGSTQVQGRATMAGNLCNASPAADSVPAMVAAGAIARIVGPDGSRDVPVENIATGPGKTSLKKGEIVESILLPKRPSGTGDAYLRFIPRTEMDIAVVGVGVCLTLEHGICSAAKVGLGAVAATVLVVEDAAKALIGTPVDEAALDALAAACTAAATPINDKRGTVEFRKEVAGTLARRAALIALERAKANMEAGK